MAEAIYSVEGAQRMRLKTNLCCRTETDKKRKKSVSFSFFTALVLLLSPLSVKTFRVALDRVRESSLSYEMELSRQESDSIDQNVGLKNHFNPQLKPFLEQILFLCCSYLIGNVIFIPFPQYSQVETQVVF